MGNYRTTVILNTDIVDSTPRLSAQTQAEMSLQRKQHRQFISETAAKHQGSVFQQERDAYLLEFPSVTGTCLAAIEMHQNLRSMQSGKGEKQRLAIRAVITVGDILHQGSDAMGMTMSLTARLEKITPSDEIYLSHAAWLVLNKAEIQTSFVNEFNFKGFSEPEKIYKVDQKSGIRVLTDQCIVLADAYRFTDFTKSNSPDVIECFLLEYDDLMSTVCEKHGGKTNRDAITMIWQNWKGISERFNIGRSIGAHKGKIHVFRSYVFGEAIHVTSFLSDLGRQFKPDINQISVVTSGTVKDSAKGTHWENKFREVDSSNITDEKNKAVIRAYGAYWFNFEDDSPR